MKPLQSSIAWEVKEEPVAIPGTSSRSKALLRSDNGALLGIRSERYTLFRNAELMALADKISSSSDFAIAGYDEFCGGKKVLAYLQNTQAGLCINNHPIREYMLIGNTHDGKSCVFIGTANYLVRCTNQFSRDLRVFSERHVGKINFDSDEVKHLVESYNTGRDQLYRGFERMSKVPATQHHIDRLVEQLIPGKSPELLRTKLTDDADERMNRMELLRAGIEREMNALGNNIWGLFNGVTWYTSHDIRSHVTSIGNVTGVAQEMNRKAFEFCMKTV